jgi:hypothetical protein
MGRTGWLAFLALPLALACGGSGASAAGGEGCAGGEVDRVCRERGDILVPVDGSWSCVPRAADRAECEARGGTYVTDPPYWSACWEPTPDAGRPCTDSADCYGFCEAPPGTAGGARATGTCSDRTGTVCWTAVEGGVVQGPVCI